MTRRLRHGREELNPYVALTDTTLNLVLVMVFFVAALTAVGRVSWDDIRYKDAQKEFAKAVKQLIAVDQRPVPNVSKNDPPGTQRWVFANSVLFTPGTAALSSAGQATLDRFALALRKNANTWRRIRVEGHTQPTLAAKADRWEDATNRAAAVARFLVNSGGIPPYFIATAGRGGQDPLKNLALNNPAHARIEIVLEYAKSAADLKSKVGP
ncbi:OmpA family protein [Deinococcus detaillensis]|uniref:OmpA family protein n=1 Tax=Deinococcus detaillensis TaxID=2592048 RepID=A0A553UPI0_9DEIO|nr:OmpA family protein [Deinococcus detaillensis]TSA82129.1 OmpA family protein [Deinococcus detaillensis]